MIRSGSICASFLYNYLTSDFECKDKNGDSLTKNTNKLRCLSDTLANYGGVLSKLSQILCLNDEKNTVFSDCKPFSKEKTIAYFKDQFSEENMKHNPHLKKVTDIDFNVYKSGSVGQVHIAKYKDKRIIFKVQYVGLIDQTLKDLNMLDKIASFIYYFADIKSAMVDIKTKMYEELDYEMEMKNQLSIEKLYKDSDYVHIPKIIPEFCTDKILAMRHAKGVGLKDFLSHSTENDRNIVGTNIIKFIFTNIYVHGILYSDVHYGNFLVRSDNSISVLDFGCLHYMKDSLTKNIRQLYLAILDNKRDSFYRTVKDMGILTNSTGSKSKEYMYSYFRQQYEPWISDSFEFTEKWLDKATDKDTDLMKEWALPQDIVYLNKIPYGAYHILTKLGVKGNFRKIFQEIFSSIKIN